MFRLLPWLLLALSCGQACSAATVYDLRTQWSRTSNPNGPWSLLQGSSLLPRDPDWTPLSNTDPAYNNGGIHRVQPAWAPGNQNGHFLPGWFKASVNPLTSGSDWKRGDVVFHTTDVFNGQSSGPASVVFTAPSAGTATISGFVFNGRNNLSRDQVWKLLVRGSVVASGDLPGNGKVTRTTKTKFKLAPVAVAAGDTVQLVAVENGGGNGAGDFVGVDLKVSVVP